MSAKDKDATAAPAGKKGKKVAVPAKEKPRKKAPAAKKKTESADDDWGQEFQECLEDLSPQQTKFVLEFVKTRNGVQSYRQAYGEHLSYSACGTSAHHLLKTPKIRKAVRITANTLLKKFSADPEFIINELAKMAHVNMDDFIQIHDDGSAVTDLSMADRNMLAGVEEFSAEEFFEPSPIEGEDPIRGRKVKIKLTSKRAVLMDLAKINKMFSDNFSPLAETKKIIAALEAGELTDKEAAYKFTALGLPLPRVIEIMLTKEKGDPEGNNDIPATDEELNKRMEEAMKSREDQLARFLPTRVAEVIQMKDDLKSADSFSHERVSGAEFVD